MTEEKQKCEEVAIPDAKGRYEKAKAEKEKVADLEALVQERKEKNLLYVWKRLSEAEIEHLAATQV